MKNYLLLLLLFCAHLLLSQDVLLFEDSPSTTLVYRYHHLSGPEAPFIRQMLQNLGAPAPGARSFNLQYQYQSRILEEENQLKVCVNWEELRVTDAPDLNGFNFAELFLPVSVNYQVQLLADGQVIRTENLCQDLSVATPSYVSAYGEVVGGVYYTLAVNSVQFNYNNQSVQAVRNRHQAVDRYFAAKADFIALKSRMDQLTATPPLPNELAAIQQEVNQMRQKFDQLSRAGFWQRLALRQANAYDPEGLRGMQTDCDADLTYVQSWLNEQQANLHVLYYEQGLILYEQGREQAAYDAFCASLRVNDCFAPSHYFVAYYDFANNKVDAAAQRLQKILNQYETDPATRTNARQLAQGVVRFYLDAGQAAVAQRDYPAGVALYQDAIAYSRSLRDFQFGQREATSRIQEAYTYDFQDRIDRVVGLHNQRQHQTALTSLDETLAFQQEFGIVSNYDTRRLAASIVNSLYDEQLANIQQLRQAKNWEAGLQAITKTKRLLADYPGLVSNTSNLANERQLIVKGQYAQLYETAEARIRAQQLDQALQDARAAADFAQRENLAIARQSEAQIARVQRLRYQRFVRGGNQSREQKRYQIALEQYGQAQLLEQQLPYLDAASSLAQDVQQTAILLVEENYQTVIATAATDNQRLAQSQAQIQQLSHTYGLSAEPRVQIVLQQLNDQQCGNARDLLLPAQEQQLAQQQVQGNFVAARNSLNQIKALLNQYPHCGLSEESILRNEAVVTACASYQETLLAAERAEDELRYKVAIEQYVAAARLYQQTSVQSRLAGHAAFDLYPYIRQHHDYRMALAGGHYFLDQRKHEEALSLLQLLIQRGATTRQTEHLQLRVGTALAAQYYVASADWKTTYYSFVSKDDRKPYREMYKAFRKQWRSL